MKPRETHTATFLKSMAELITAARTSEIDQLVDLLVRVRARGGRVFVLGVGGSAANASHAVNDFRKLCNIESYSPMDNVSELTARINDDGWEDSIARWLEVSRLSERDMLFVFSVGGGCVETGVSMNIVRAVDYCLSIGADVGGVVGRDGGYTSKKGHAVVIAPGSRPDWVTPHVEAFHGLILHLLVSHPLLQKNSTKWSDLGDQLDARPA